MAIWIKYSISKLLKKGTVYFRYNDEEYTHSRTSYSLPELFIQNIHFSSGLNLAASGYSDYQTDVWLVLCVLTLIIVLVKE